MFYYKVICSLTDGDKEIKELLPFYHSSSDSLSYRELQNLVIAHFTKQAPHLSFSRINQIVYLTEEEFRKNTGF